MSTIANPTPNTVLTPSIRLGIAPVANAGAVAQQVAANWSQIGSHTSGLLTNGIPANTITGAPAIAASDILTALGESGPKLELALAALTATDPAKIAAALAALATPAPNPAPTP